jgi:hypothetical protein
MTEGQDAAAASAPARGDGRGTPAAPGWVLAGSGVGHAAGPGAEGRGTGWPGYAPAQPGRADPGTPGWPGRGSAGLPPDRSRPPVGPPGSWSVTGTGFGAAGDDDEADEPFARVDARRLEAALLELRHPIVTVPLLFEAPGVAGARAERVKLLSQIDDYLLPRLRQSGAPILVALVGSTGAGKSTLMNTVVGSQVSATGIRRPTTNSPVLACHPDDMRWFAENVFLPTLPRVRQQGLAMPGRDGLLVLAASELMPQGVAILDTPDIDSVVEAHHEFAHQFLDASDLWLFVTTARRYADAAVWEMLKDARDRGAALAVALSRVPPGSANELSAHFDSMLVANGLADIRRFIVPETVVTDSMLPPKIAAPVRDWLTDTARLDDRRVAVLTQTMSGVLDTFRSRVPALADHVIEQLALRRRLRQTVEDAYTASLEQVEGEARSGGLLQGEVLARWQDFAGAGDLLRSIQVRRGRAGKQKKLRTPTRAGALREALQASLESLVVAAAGRAADKVVTSWQDQPAGASLLRELDAAARRLTPGVAPGEEEDFLAAALADLGLASEPGVGIERKDSAALARPTVGLAEAAAAAVVSWQDHVLELVRAENVTKRSIARVVSFDEEALALVLTIGVLTPASDDEDTDDDPDAAPERLLASLFGAGLLRDIGARVRLDLRERVRELFRAEARRYFEIVDSAGVPDETAATELLQAGYALEGAR